MYDHQPWHPACIAAVPSVHRSRPMIEVSGEGTVTAPPDRAMIDLGVITEDPALSAAQRDNAASTADIVHSLVQLGIPNEQIRTVSYKIEIQYNYIEGKQILRGYQVTHMLQVTLDQVHLTGIVVDTAVHHGANSVSNIRFSISNPEMYYNQSLSLALKNAKAKAMTIARTIGAALVEQPIMVQEESRTREPIPYQATLFAESAAATPIQQGELNITAMVKAAYTYN